MRAYCDRVGLEFYEAMLKWDKAEGQAQFERWGPAWYRTLLDSSGFANTSPTGSSDYPPLPAPIEAAIEEAQPFYEKLYARRLSS